MALDGARMRWQAAIALCAAWAAAGCASSTGHAIRMREKSRTFEVHGTARILEHKNPWGEDTGEAAARAAAREDAQTQVRRRIVFGMFDLSGDKLEIRALPPPRYWTLPLEEKRVAGVYVVAEEALVPEDAFGKGEDWTSLSVRYEGEAGANLTQSQHKALKAFLQQAAAARYGAEAPRELAGEVRAIIERSETLSNRRLVDVWGTVRFR
ncbi:MAG: hypothetical protein V2A58_02165 [Planctomycetota bacterium]